MARRLNKNNFVRLIVHVFFGPTWIYRTNNGLNMLKKGVTKRIIFSKRRLIEIRMFDASGTIGEEQQQA